MSKDWAKAVDDFRLVSRINDRIRIVAPTNSMAAEYNGQDGTITGFVECWVLACVGGAELRFRPDEIRIL